MCRFRRTINAPVPVLFLQVVRKRASSVPTGRCAELTIVDVSDVRSRGVGEKVRRRFLSDSGMSDQVACT